MRENSFYWNPANLDLKNSNIINVNLDNNYYNSYESLEILLDRLNENYKKKYLSEIRNINSIKQSLNEYISSMDVTSDSVLYSVIRRISRESNASMNILNDLCMANLDLIYKVIEDTKSKFAIIVNNAELLDRGSLRFFTQLIKISTKKEFVLIWNFKQNVLNDSTVESSNIEDIFINGRFDIFKRVANNANPAITMSADIPAYGEKINWGDFPFGSSLIDESAKALITQNYDRALLICKKQLDSEKKSDTFKIIGLVCSNIGYYKIAYKYFLMALSCCEEAEEKTHLNYLCGLIATKRLYDFKLARKHYNTALDIIKTCETSQGKLEKAWVYNGLSFLDVLENSTGYKLHKFTDILQREIEAMDLIKSSKGYGPVYLRFNLISNITFLLEINKKYEEAFTLWSNKMGEFFSNRQSDLKVAYNYRLAMLAYKCNKVDFSISILETISNLLKPKNNFYTLEKIYYSLGYINLGLERYEEAKQYFQLGIDACLTVKEKIGAYKHFVGFNKAINRKVNQNGHIEELEEYYDKIFENSEGNFKQYTISSNLEAPKTKLSSYNPIIDLEDTPKVDLNKYLISITKRSIDNVQSS
ncbi:hypothetical protein [Bacillus sp. NPDC077027]|uniref:hypothetical protein n=1 Tax=Bacillus sp. NPDC077027 TaxID=3390548 RepID=UPI003CFDB9A6